jgi:hypothetical protein
MAPDLDVLISSRTDPLLFLEYHRQFTHSLVFIPFGAGLVALAIWALLGRRRGWSHSDAVSVLPAGLCHARAARCLHHLRHAAAVAVFGPAFRLEFCVHHRPAADPAAADAGDRCRAGPATLAGDPGLDLGADSTCAWVCWPGMRHSCRALRIARHGAMRRWRSRPSPALPTCCCGRPCIGPAIATTLTRCVWVRRRGIYPSGIRLRRWISPGTFPGWIRLSAGAGHRTFSLVQHGLYRRGSRAPGPGDGSALLLLPNEIRPLWSIELDPATQYKRTCATSCTGIAGPPRWRVSRHARVRRCQRPRSAERAQTVAALGGCRRRRPLSVAASQAPLRMPCLLLAAPPPGR